MTMTFKVTLCRAQRYNLRSKSKSASLSISKHRGLNLFNRALIKSINTPCCVKLSLLFESESDKHWKKLSGDLTFVLQALQNPAVSCSERHTFRQVIFSLPVAGRRPQRHSFPWTAFHIVGKELNEVLITFERNHISNLLDYHLCECQFVLHIVGTLDHEPIDYNMYLQFVKEHKVEYLNDDLEFPLTSLSSSESESDDNNSTMESFRTGIVYPKISFQFNGKLKKRETLISKRKQFLIYCSLYNKQ